MQAWLLDYLPLLIVLSSLLPGLLIFTLKEQQVALRTFLNLLGVTLKLVLVFLMWQGVKEGESYYYRIAFLPGADLILQADALSLLFVVLSSVLWLATTIYAIGYLEHSPLRSRFFGYFSLCVSATVGLALAGNLVTFLLFYELLTLATFPLVVHRGTPQSLAAGRRYLAYTLSGGLLLMLGVSLLHLLAGSPDFTPGGYLAPLLASGSILLQVAFALLIAGLGVKAALFPLHGWLPQAMVAPAPVSASATADSISSRSTGSGRKCRTDRRSNWACVSTHCAQSPRNRSARYWPPARWRRQNRWCRSVSRATPRKSSVSRWRRSP